MASILEVSEIRAAGGTTALALNSNGTVDMPGGMTIGGTDPFDQLGIERGTRAQRPTPAGEAVRFNTDDSQLEHYHELNSGPGDALWVPVGGRKLVSWVERKDAWSSLDITWGPGTGTNPTQHYYSYEIVMNFFEPGGGNGEYYFRLMKQDGNVDTGTSYYYMGSGWHANDGRPRDASGTGGRNYVNLTARSGSYELQSNGEASYTIHLYLSNTPNSSTSTYWSYWWHGGGATEQNGGDYRGGGCWRGASQLSGKGYALGGIRIYNNVAMRSVSSGCNFACAVYANQPAVRDYPETGPWLNL